MDNSIKSVMLYKKKNRYIKYDKNNTMKNTVLTCLLFLGTLLCHGQNGSPSDALLGTWVFQEASSMAKLSPTKQQEVAESTSIQTNLATYFSGRQLHFNSDGTYYVLFANGLRIDGQWNLTNDILSMTTNSGGASTQQIVFMNANYFYLLVANYNESNLLFPELHYAKN